MELFPKVKEKLPQWAFNGEFGKNFAAAFDLQMWCLGCDIRKANDNLLLSYGFTRRRPQNRGGSSYYSKIIDETCSIHLWGFALAVTTNHSGLYLRRHERRPLFSMNAKISPHCCHPYDMPKFRLPCGVDEVVMASHLFKAAILELLRYEAMVDILAGKEYRANCVKAHRTRKIFKKIPLIDMWSELSLKMEDLPKSHFSCGTDVICK